MKHFFRASFSMIFALVLSMPILAAEPSGSAYLDGGNSKTALILCHGRGKHPTWKVVEPLRKGVHEVLEYHTLSLQMPNDDKNWRDYAEDFPEAHSIIEKGIDFLRNEKGVTRIYLMGHSMGARMASAYVAKHPDTTLAGLIIAGCRNNGDSPLSCKENLEKVKIPVLDIWGGNNGKDSRAASERKNLVSESYQQVEVSEGNHKFHGREEEFVSSVIDWLKGQGPPEP